MLWTVTMQVQTETGVEDVVVYAFPVGYPEHGQLFTLGGMRYYEPEISQGDIYQTPQGNYLLFV